MGKIVIVAYRPRPGKEKELKKLISEHMPVLKAQGLITDRQPIVMQTEDGCVIEVFEWKSAEAIEAAHTNAEVGKLWERFSEVCSYEVPANLKEFHNMFPGFEAVN